MRSDRVSRLCCRHLVQAGLALLVALCFTALIGPDASADERHRLQHDELRPAIETIQAVAEDDDELVEVPAPTVRVTELLESEVVVTARAFFPAELRSQRYRIRTEFLQRVVERCREVGVDLNQSNLQELSGEVAVRPPNTTAISRRPLRTAEAARLKPDGPV